MLVLANAFPGGVAAQGAPDRLVSLERALTDAQDSLQRGAVDVAERQYRDALVDGWLLLGELHSLARSWPEARDAFQEASRLSPQDRGAQRELAGILVSAGDAARAVAILAPLAANDVGDGETRRQLANALAASGQLEAAGRALDEASALASDDSELCYLLATDNLWLKRVEAAERLFTRLLEARPIPETRVLIGRTYRDVGDFEHARALLREALVENPSVRHAHYYLGTMILGDPRAGADRLDQAIAEFKAELALDRQDAVANDQLGVALLDAKRPAEALPALETAARTEERWTYLFHLGRCQLELDRPADAAATLERALADAREVNATEDELSGVRYRLGSALRKLGREQEAAPLLAAAARTSARSLVGGTAGAASSAVPLVEMSPLARLSQPQRRELLRFVGAGLARAYLNLGVMQVQRGRFADAAQLLEKAAALDSERPEVQRALGLAYFNARQYQAALAPLTRALAAQPGDARLARMLAMTALSSGNYVQAAGLLEKDAALEQDPALQYAYGVALVHTGRAREALEVCSRLLKQRGDSPELSVLVGQAEAQLGDYQAALEALTRALRQNSDVPEANATLGFVYSKQGRLLEAAAALRAAIASNPGDEGARQSLAAVLSRLQGTGRSPTHAAMSH